MDLRKIQMKKSNTHWNTKTNSYLIASFATLPVFWHPTTYYWQHGEAKSSWIGCRLTGRTKRSLTGPAWNSLKLKFLWKKVPGWSWAIFSKSHKKVLVLVLVLLVLVVLLVLLVVVFCYAGSTFQSFCRNNRVSSPWWPVLCSCTSIILCLVSVILHVLHGRSLFISTYVSVCSIWMLAYQVCTSWTMTSQARMMSASSKVVSKAEMLRSCLLIPSTECTCLLTQTSRWYAITSRCISNPFVRALTWLFGLLSPCQAANFLNARRKELMDCGQGPLLEASSEEIWWWGWSHSLYVHKWHTSDDKTHQNRFENIGKYWLLAVLPRRPWRIMS